MNNLTVALVFVLARLKEPSTWLAVSVGSGAVGVALQSNVGLGASLLAGVVAALTPEHK